MKKVLIAIGSVLAAALIVVAGLFIRWNPSGDTEERYVSRVEANTHFENTMEEALPQTEIYDIITNHFIAPLPEGKTVKKAIVIGYDGCRSDVLNEIDGKDNGAINRLLKTGGKMYLSYCGGVPYPAENTQDTSTAPGWCSMLTGVWADVHGITKNDVIKSNDHLTMLTTLVENGTIDSSAFCVSWKGHFSRDNATYLDEVQYTKDKGLNVSFICSKNDAGTQQTVIDDLSKEDCSDFIFSILEFCDHSGHQKGFYTGYGSYKKAFAKADSAAENILNTIESRRTFNEEDWLIVLTSDHGGIKRAHGGASIQERFTHIVVNKDIDL